MKKKITNQFEKKVKWVGTFFVAICLLSNLNSFAQPGAALNILNGTDYVTLPSGISTSSLVGGNNVTIEAWVNPNSISGSPHVIVGNYNNNANQLQFLLRRNGNFYDFFVGNGVTLYTGIFSVAGTATINTWQHVAGVYDGTVMAIYVNGVLSSTAAVSYTFGATANAIKIGTDAINENYSGSLDEIRIWNVARTQCQINTYMNCEIPSSYAGLIANYHFNEGIAAGNNATVTALMDATANNFTGTLTAFALTGATSNWIAPGGVTSGFTTSVASPNYTSSSLSVCQNNTVVLGATGANTYTWSGGITNAVAFTPTASTSYTLLEANTVTHCSNTAVANVTVNPSPTISVTNGTICGGNSFTMMPTGANTYTYQGGNAVVSPTNNASYTITGTSAAGCAGANTATCSIMVNASPTVSAMTSTNSICSGSTATLTASGANTYTWNTTATTTMISVSPTITTTYTVTGTSANGCTNMTAITESVSLCTGIQTYGLFSPSIRLFPNPANNLVNIICESNFEHIELTDISGRLVKKETVNASFYTLTVDNINSGIYFVKIYKENNQLIGINKLIVDSK